MTQEHLFKCYFVGYRPNEYKLWSPEERKFVIGRDVIFDETKFFFFRYQAKIEFVKRMKWNYNLSKTEHNKKIKLKELKKKNAEETIKISDN